MCVFKSIKVHLLLSELYIYATSLCILLVWCHESVITDARNEHYKIYHSFFTRCPVYCTTVNTKRDSIQRFRSCSSAGIWWSVYKHTDRWHKVCDPRRKLWLTARNVIQRERIAGFYSEQWKISMLNKEMYSHQDHLFCLKGVNERRCSPYVLANIIHVSMYVLYILYSLLSRPTCAQHIYIYIYIYINNILCNLSTPACLNASVSSWGSIILLFC